MIAWLTGATLCLITLGCSERTDTPVAPSVVSATENATARLEFVTESDGLMVGGSTRAVATLREGQSTRQVTAQWQSSNPATISIGDDAILHARTIGEATITARHGDLVATKEVNVVASFVGSWTGRVKVTSCRRESGSGPDPCRFIIGGQHPFGLDIQQRGRLISGAITMFLNAATGSLQATAARQIASAQEPLPLQRGTDVIVVTAMSLSISGSYLDIDRLELRREVTNALGRQAYVEEYQMVSSLAMQSVPR